MIVKMEYPRRSPTPPSNESGAVNFIGVIFILVSFAFVMATIIPLINSHEKKAGAHENLVTLASTDFKIVALNPDGSYQPTRNARSVLDGLLTRLNTLSRTTDQFCAGLFKVRNSALTTDQFTSTAIEAVTGVGFVDLSGSSCSTNLEDAGKAVIAQMATNLKAQSSRHFVLLADKDGKTPVAYKAVVVASDPPIVMYTVSGAAATPTTTAPTATPTQLPTNTPTNIPTPIPTAIGTSINSQGGERANSPTPNVSVGEGGVFQF